MKDYRGKKQIKKAVSKRMKDRGYSSSDTRTDTSFINKAAEDNHRAR